MFIPMASATTIILSLVFLFLFDVFTGVRSIRRDRALAAKRAELYRTAREERLRLAALNHRRELDERAAHLAAGEMRRRVLNGERATPQDYDECMGGIWERLDRRGNPYAY